jgi:NifB/MoaA-like Fe-S oxidoreductase
VGAVRSFLDALKRGFPDLPRLDGRRLAFVTGARMGEVMVPIVPRLHERTGARLSLLPVENRLFGPTVTTAGLLPGADIAAAVEQAGPFDDVLLPAESLNDDGLFIDSMSLVELRGRLAGARAVAGYELAAALSQL